MTESDRLQQKAETLDQEVVRLQSAIVCRGVRKRSRRSFWGLPLYEIALGPDPERQEVRGHARGILAIGDIATGFIALGGLARGGIALGGVAVGGLCFGGCAMGLLAIGGLAVGAGAVGGLAIGLLALGGGAVGLVAVGGGAVGYYACGGGAYGEHVLDAMQRDPEAIRFFSKWLPGLRGWSE